MVVYHLLGKTGRPIVVVNGTRQIPNGNFQWDALFPFPGVFPGRWNQRRSKPEGPELVKNNKWNAHFHSEIPFGNFGLPFKKSRFPEKISVRGDKINLSIYISIEISGFSG